MRKKKILVVILGISLVFSSIYGVMLYNDIEQKKEQAAIQKAEDRLKIIQAHYASRVITDRITHLYELVNDKYEVVGTVGKSQVLEIAEMELTASSEYFYCEDLGYYVKYNDVSPQEEKIDYDTRFLNLVPFNESIVLEGKTVMYDENGNIVLALPKSSTFPIIVKETNTYGINYNERLLWINKSDVKEVVKQTNSTKKIAKALRVLCYHKVYDPKEENCGLIICHSMSQIDSHFSYLKKHNYYTMSMQDMLWYIDGKANMPYNSVCLTFDDGGKNTKNLVKLLEKHDLHATLFLIGSKYRDYMVSDNLELQSHTFDMHSDGYCSITPRGSAIVCLSRSKVLADLKKSKELTNAIAFSYPFYEYTKETISRVKEAGFLLAFEDNTGLVKVKDNKFTISRYTLSNVSTVNQMASLLH